MNKFLLLGILLFSTLVFAGPQAYIQHQTNEFIEPIDKNSVSYGPITQDMLQEYGQREGNRFIISNLPDRTSLNGKVVEKYIKDQGMIGIDAIQVSDVNGTLFDGTYNTNYIIDNAHHSVFNGATFENFGGNNSISILNSENVTIASTTFTGIFNNDLGNPDIGLIYAQNSPKLYIDGLTITDILPGIGGELVYLILVASPDSQLLNVNTNNVANSDPLLRFSSSGIMIENSENVTIINFDFNSQLGSNSLTSYGIYGVNSNNLTINDFTSLNYLGSNVLYGIQIVNSDFLDISVVYFQNLRSARLTGLSLDGVLNSSIVGVTLIQMNGTVSGIVMNSVQFSSFDSINFIQDIASLDEFIGISISSSNDLSISNVLMNDLDVENSFIGLSVLNSNNLYFLSTYIVSNSISGGKFVGMNVTGGTNLTFIDYQFINIESTATGLDFDNSLSIYGGILTSIVNFTMAFSDIDTVFGEVNIFGLIGSQVIANITGSTFRNIIGKTIQVLRFEDSLLYLNGSNLISGISGQKSYGVRLTGSDDSVIDDLEITDFSLSTFGYGIIVETSSGVTLNEITITLYDSDAPFFDNSVVAIFNSTSITLLYIDVKNIFSTAADVNVFEIKYSSNIVVGFSTISNAESTLGSIIGLSSVGNSNLNLFNITITNLEGGTSTTLGLDTVEDPDGYGLIFETTTSSLVYNNTISGVNHWLIQDQASSITFLSNLVDGLQDFIVLFSRPSDVLFDTDQNGPNKLLIWIATVTQSEQAGNYSIFKDGVQVATGDWQSSVEISYLLENLDFGEFVYRIDLIQTNGLISSDSVIVIATELTAPGFSRTPTDIRMVENNLTTLIWVIDEVNPSDYSIFRNGSEIAFGSFQSGIPIEFDLSSLEAGVYIFEIEVRDNSGNIASDSVIVIILEPRPLDLVEYTQEVNYVFGQTDNNVIFIIDGSLGGSYVVSWDDVNLGSGFWAPLEENVFSVDGLDVGQYIYTFLIIDEDGNTLDFTVIISVIPLVTSETEDSGFDFRTLTGILEDVTNFELTPEYLIPLAAALFVGGIIFVPGMKIIRKYSAKAADSATKVSGNITSKVRPKSKAKPKSKSKKRTKK